MAGVVDDAVPALQSFILNCFVIPFAERGGLQDLCAHKNQILISKFLGAVVVAPSVDVYDTTKLRHAFSVNLHQREQLSIEHLNHATLSVTERSR
jgi:hypothetical protein